MNDKDYLTLLLEKEHERETERKLLEMAITVNGVDCQVLHTIQELSELSVELTKWLEDFNNGVTDETRILNVLEEMTDVKIMLSQLVLIMKFSPEEMRNTHQEKLQKFQNHIDLKLRKEDKFYIL